MTIVIVFFAIVLIGMAAVLALGLKLAIGERKTPTAHDDLWRDARDRWATGRALEPSPESIWTSRRFLVRTDQRVSQVFDTSGRPIAWINDDGLVDLTGQPQIGIRTIVPERNGGMPRDILHPGGAAYGRLALDRQIYRSLRLHLFDPVGNRVAGFRTADRNGHVVMVEDNGGQPLAIVRRAVDQYRSGEDAVELVAPLQGGFHALVLIAALRAFAWQRSEWHVAPDSPMDFS